MQAWRFCNSGIGKSVAVSHVDIGLEAGRSGVTAHCHKFRSRGLSERHLREPHLPKRMHVHSRRNLDAARPYIIAKLLGEALRGCGLPVPVHNDRFIWCTAHRFYDRGVLRRDRYRHDRTGLNLRDLETGARPIFPTQRRNVAATLRQQRSKPYRTAQPSRTDFEYLRERLRCHRRQCVVRRGTRIFDAHGRPRGDVVRSRLVFRHWRRGRGVAGSG